MLEDLSKPPKEILDAAINDRLVIFVGTGPSISMGAADWTGFAENVLDQLRKQKVIDYGFIDQIKDLDSRKKLSIARSIAEEKQIKIDYERSIMPEENFKTDSKIYDHLCSIGSYYVTTNYDNFLHRPIQNIFSLDSDDYSEVEERKIIFEPEKINEDSFSEKNAIVHLHGSFEDENSNNLVITTKDYLEHYHNENKSKEGVRNFLKHIFNGDYTILFVGYGLAENEILEYILAKSEHNSRDRNNEKKSRNRFWLHGIYNHQEDTYDHLKRYYRENFDITMLLYSLDKKKYETLEDILAKWKFEIHNKTTPTEDKIRFANKVLGL